MATTKRGGRGRSRGREASGVGGGGASGDDPLGLFLPPVRDWFRERFGAPTPPQARGWPEIAAGRNVLILAPTGSGKTLAAFLAALDHLWRSPEGGRPGVRILYVSPLKALNQDVALNLEGPLRGILETSRRAGGGLRELRVGIRTGDTPAEERRRMVRSAPDILITTPESLHLLLTSGACRILETVTHVIVDEIHALCPNKRGVFLALLLERLERATGGRSFARIGLSATLRPLEEAAAFLGGGRIVREGDSERYEPRPVTIVDTGTRRNLDLRVTIPPGGFGRTEEGSIWPGVEGRIADWILEHRSTLIFANNRRVVERLAARLNELLEGTTGDSGIEGRREGGTFVRAHHGSLSLEERRATEGALKSGELRGVAATASLEMGIDMGSVELVCQVESPGEISRALQRVGRAGHVAGGVGKGRLVAKTPSDLLESAALARAMRAGEVEFSRTPRNCLDILAQQLIAIAARGAVGVREAFDLVRGAHPYRDLSAKAFEGVLELISGRYAVDTFRDLRARVSWDRTTNALRPLPGTLRLAVTGGGSIPDTGQYAARLGEDGPRLGELDEEFVLERRVGDCFLLGTSTWRIEAIDPHRVIVSPAPGERGLPPFWRGEGSNRSAELGKAIGELSRRLRAVAEAGEGSEEERALARDYDLEPAAAAALRRFARRQLLHSGALPDDRTILVETFRDQTGELGLGILSVFGSRFHHGLKLAVQGVLRERLGIVPAALHGPEGVVFRLPDMSEPPDDVLEGLSPRRASELLRGELGSSALFGLRFRQAAGRALLLPRPEPGKRAPLWLQRLRAKDLLQAASRHPDFPIVIEAYRECLDEDLDLPGLERALVGIERGEIAVSKHRGEVASPFLSSLLFAFERAFLYEWDTPAGPAPASQSRGGAGAGAGAREVSEITSELIDEVAVNRLADRLRGAGRPPRDATEAFEYLRRMGDLTETEARDRGCAGFFGELRRDGRASLLEFAGRAGWPRLWVPSESEGAYRAAFGEDGDGIRDAAAARGIVAGFLRERALAGAEELRARYPMTSGEAGELLEGLAVEGRLRRLGDRFGEPERLAEARRITLAMRREESVAVAPEVFVEFAMRRQGFPARAGEVPRSADAEGVLEALYECRGVFAPLEAWETWLLPARLKGYRAGMLEVALSSGDWIWVGGGGEGTGGGEARLGFFPREDAGLMLGAAVEDGDLSADGRAVRERLSAGGAFLLEDLALAMGWEPSRARRALGELARRGEASNDRLEGWREIFGEGKGSGRRSDGGSGRVGMRRRLALSGRMAGRWFSVPRGRGSEEERAGAWIEAILDRYGVACRETADLAGGPSWRELAGALDRREWRGELRRGYFVEGFSGAQFARAEDAEALKRWGSGRGSEESVPVMVAAGDPANLFGSGAPFDFPMTEDGGRLPRSFTNVLFVSAGRPILIADNVKGRLRAPAPERLSGESGMAIARKLARMPGPKRLSIVGVNGVAAADSAMAEALSAAGFLREHRALTRYRMGEEIEGWSGVFEKAVAGGGGG